MASSFSLKFNTKDTEAAFTKVRQQMAIVTARAINTAAGSAATRLARDTARDMRLKVEDVRPRIDIVKAHQMCLRAIVTANQTRIPMIKFAATGPEPSLGRGHGVRARLPGKKYVHAFIATMRSGHRGVFQRVRGRTPVSVWDPNKSTLTGRAFADKLRAALTGGDMPGRLPIQLLY